MPKPFSILLVDDDPTSIATLRRILNELGQLRFATSGADALRLAHQRAPDLVLLDVEMPGMTGFEVCSAMKVDPDPAAGARGAPARDRRRHDRLLEFARAAELMSQAGLASRQAS